MGNFEKNLTSLNYVTEMGNYKKKTIHMNYGIIIEYYIIKHDKPKLRNNDG